MIFPSSVVDLSCGEIGSGEARVGASYICTVKNVSTSSYTTVAAGDLLLTVCWVTLTM